MQDKGKGILEAGHSSNSSSNVPRLPPQPHNMVEPMPYMLAFVNNPTLMNINIHQGNSSHNFVRMRSVSSSILPRSRSLDETEQQNTQILNLDEAVEIELKHVHVLNPDVNIKKLRRTVSNRLSAQRARLKKSTYIHELEGEISKLQETIDYLTPRVESYKNEKSMLRVENNLLEQKLNTCTVQSRLSQIEIEKNKSEVNRLQELYRSQQQEREMMMMNNMMMQDESWFGRFQNLLVLDGTNINGDFYELDFPLLGDHDDRFPNYDDINIFQSPSINPDNKNNFQPTSDAPF